MRVGVSDVDALLVGGESDAVGAGHVVDEQFQLAVADAVDAVELEFLGGVVVLFGEAVGRVGEIEIAVRLIDSVVGAVEPLAFVLVGENGDLTVFLGAGDAAVTVFAGGEAAGLIEGQTVGTDKLAFLVLTRKTGLRNAVSWLLGVHFMMALLGMSVNRRWSPIHTDLR